MQLGQALCLSNLSKCVARGLPCRQRGSCSLQYPASGARFRVHSGIRPICRRASASRRGGLNLLIGTAFLMFQLIPSWIHGANVAPFLPSVHLLANRHVSPTPPYRAIASPARIVAGAGPSATAAHGDPITAARPAPPSMHFLPPKPSNPANTEAIAPAQAPTAPHLSFPQPSDPARTRAAAPAIAPTASCLFSPQPAYPPCIDGPQLRKRSQPRLPPSTSACP